MTENRPKIGNDKKTDNLFVKEQPLRHALANVVQDNEHLKINKQYYQILINKGEAIDIELLRRKYDPYLDQYDFLVGDVSSGHLRLKGFYKDNVRTAIDRKQKAIADYLIEYCNPGSAYFILELISPVHHYANNSDFKEQRYRHKSGLKFDFKKRYVKKTKFSKHNTAVQKGQGHRHSFVIRKRKDR